MAEIITRDAVDQDFNTPSRHIVMRLDIFFDGLQSDPLIITKDNYLIDATLLEEIGAEDSNPLGTISANELSFSLYNSDGIFSPTNTNSPYYGKIKTNVPIIPYMRPETTDNTEVNWIKMGEYYVSNWSASVTGIDAFITAEDELQQVFLEKSPSIPVGLNKKQAEFFQEVFNALGYTAKISRDLNDVLLYTFTEGEQKSYLQE